MEFKIFPLPDCLSALGIFILLETTILEDNLKGAKGWPVL